jgi:predicted flap endonuclease-1-like 5' DNA nuclease
MPSVSEIEGIGPTYTEKLNHVGVITIDGLLDRGATKEGRSALAQASGISENLLLTWVNHADLFRVKGVAGQYAELLHCAGVDTVPELAQRNAANLHAAMVKTNDTKNLVRALPDLTAVTGWISQAKTLPRRVEH